LLFEGEFEELGRFPLFEGALEPEFELLGARVEPALAPDHGGRSECVER
jgi:hypothetical protein